MLLAVSDMSSGIACLLHAVVQLLMVTQVIENLSPVDLKSAFAF